VRVRASAAEGVGFALSGPAASADVPRDSSNLAVRAARVALDRHLRDGGSWAGLELELLKRLPSRAGLGGGSADAAASLLAAERALGVERGSEERALDLAALGSDCPFFARVGGGGLARCRGRGEEVEPWPALRGAVSVAVLVPAVECPTAEVYAQLEGARSLASGSAEELRGASAEALGGLMFNGLEVAALAQAPELRAWRALLDDLAPARWVLAGSGAGFFSVLPQPESARSALMRAMECAGSAGLEVRDAFCASPLSGALGEQREP